eukprot:gene6883-30857_t
MSSADTEWVFLQCLEPLYPLLDADTKKAVRLVHPSARKMIEARTLSLKWETELSLVGRGLVTFFQKGMPSTQDFCIMRKCPILQHVKIEGEHNLPPEESLSLSLFPNTLKSLSILLVGEAFDFELEFEHGPYDNTYPRLADLSALGSMTNLTVLHLQKYSGLIDFSFLGVCPTLRSIRFVRCDLESLQGVGALTDLTSLVLQKCEKLRDISALSGSQLSVFTLWGCQQVDDISALANCPALEEVSVAQSLMVTDVTALARCSCLIRLDLSNCQDLVDISALGSCSSLQWIDLGHCSRIHDVAPLRACPDLQFICLSYINPAVEGAHELLQANRHLLVHCLDGRYAEYDDYEHGYEDDEYQDYDEYQYWDAQADGFYDEGAPFMEDDEWNVQEHEEYVESYGIDVLQEDPFEVEPGNNQVE